MQTRKNEVVITTTNSLDMIGKFLAESLKRGWKEDFADEDTGEVVTIDRWEPIAKKGTEIDANLLQEINFFLTSGDITEVKVSNQKREGYCIERGYPNPYLVTVDVSDKKRKLLVYANSVTMATEIVQDYLEVELNTGFFFVSVKEYDNAVILEDDLDNDELTDIKFYQMEVKVIKSEMDEFMQTYIVHTSNTERAMSVIKEFITSKAKESNTEEVEFSLMIETSKILPCSKFIPIEYTKEYLPKK